MSIAFVLVGFLVFIVLFGLWILRTTQRKERAIILEQETIAIKMAGGTLDEVLVNSTKVVVATDKNTGDIVLKPIVPNLERGERGTTANDTVRVRTGFEGWLWRKFGFAWVGLWTYPVGYHLYEFEIPNETLISESEMTAGAPLEARIRHGPVIKTKELRRFITRVFLIRDIDTVEGYMSNMLVEMVLEVERPKVFAIDLKGKPFPMVYGVVSNAIGDYANDIKYEDLRKENKGAGSEFNNYMLGIRKGPPEDAPDAPHGLIVATGMRVYSLSVVGMELSAKSQEAENALAAKENAKLLGLADVERSRYEKIADYNRATGKASYVRKNVAAINSATDSTKTAIAHMDSAKSYSSKDSKITTLVTGSAGLVLSTPTTPGGGNTNEAVSTPPSNPGQGQGRQGQSGQRRRS